MRRPFTRPGFVVTSLVLVWATTAVAIAAWWPIHRSSGFVVMAVGAVLAGSAVGLLGALYRWSSAVLIPVAAAVFLAVGVPLAVPSRAVAGGMLPTVDGLVELLRGVVFGWKQLLTITLPVGEHQALLVPAYLCVYAGVVVAVSVALRARLGELALLAPSLVMIMGLAMGPAVAWHPRELALTMLCLVLVWIVWRARYRRREEELRLSVSGPDGVVGAAKQERRRVGVRTIAGALVTIAVASAAGAVAATAMPPDSQRLVLRSSIEQPFDPRSEISPLAGFRWYLLPAQRDEVLFTVSGLPEGSRLRIAALDEWNGEVFGFSAPGSAESTGVFTQVPYRIERDDPGRRVTVAITVDGYRGFWLPTAGELIAAEFTADDGDEFVYDRASGTAAIIDGVDQLSEYGLEVLLPAGVTAQELPELTPGDTVLPPVAAAPDALLAWLDDAVGVIDQPGARLVAAVDRLRSEGYISHGLDGEPPSRAGHSADRIAQLFTDRPMLGDGEQYAAAAVLLARSLGFPARVVMGFEPGEPAAVGAARAVTGGDVRAWIEVDTAEHGWVAIDPVPSLRPVPDRLPEEPVEVARPQTVLPPPEVPEPVDDDAVPPDSVQDDSAADTGIGAVLVTIAVISAWVLGGLLLLCSPFIAVLLVKARRRRRRRRQPDSLARIRGAWAEYTDALVDQGAQVPVTATRREVARIAGGERARVFAGATDRAVFAPAVPQPADADAAWVELRRLEAALGAGKGRWERLRTRLSTRSLARYSGRRASRNGVDSRFVGESRGSS